MINPLVNFISFGKRLLENSTVAPSSFLILVAIALRLDENLFGGK